MSNLHLSWRAGIALALTTAATPVLAQGLPGRVSDLEELVAAQQGRIASLESRIGPLEHRVNQMLDVGTVSVDCAAGQSIADALLSTSRRLSRVRIEISGVCHEAVMLNRDEVSLIGVTPDAAIAAPPGSRIAVFAAGGRGLRLDDLALRAPAAGGEGLRVLKGQLAAANLRLQGALTIHRGSVVEIFGAEITGANEPAFDGGNGISVGGNSFLAVFDATITDSLLHGIAVQDSVLYAGNTRLERNGEGGLSLTGGASATFDRSFAVDNGGPGVEASENSTAQLRFGTEITGNSVGVLVWAGSHASFRGVAIESNDGSGAFIGDSSSLRADVVHGVRITGNGSWGIECGPAPQVPQLIGALGASHVFGNATGQISCPGYLVSGGATSNLSVSP
jgi:hypothetical protein